METGNRKGCGSEASHRGHSIRRREQAAAQEDSTVPRRDFAAQVTPDCTYRHPIGFARRDHVLAALVVLWAPGCLLPDLQRVSDGHGGSGNSQVAGSTGTGSSAGSNSLARGVGSASTDSDMANGGMANGGMANGTATTSDTAPRGGGGTSNTPFVSVGGASPNGGTLGDPASSTSGGSNSSGGATSGGASNGGAAGSGTDCQGCWINGECYAHGAPNRANPCQHCDATATRTTWSNKNGTACDDGLYCNGLDSCSNGTCSVHVGDPCAPSDACNETNKSCCKASTTRVCTNGNVHVVDACGKDMGQVEACATTNGSCANGICGCQPGWTGKDCLRCVRYVHPAGSSDWVSPNKGLSWSDPYRTLSTALSDKTCEIWAAEGMYTPGSSRDSTFTLSPGQTLYGGFVRYQTSPDQRDIAAHPTILSGDIGVVDDAADNSYHVVTMGDQSVLDGVTITRGNATGASPLCGGAICAPAATITVRNTTIRESGTAIQEREGKMTFLSCTFEKNSRALFTMDTGMTVDVSSCQFRDNDDGIYVKTGYATVRDSVFGAHAKNAVNLMEEGSVKVYSSRFQSTVKNSGGALEVEGCTFSNNASVSVNCGIDSAGCSVKSSIFDSNTGVSVQVSRASVSGCRFSNNSASPVRVLSDSAATITNSVFYANTAPAINGPIDLSNVDVISSTFFGNSAVSSGEQPKRFLSCILWGNGSNPFDGPVTLEYSDIEGPAGTGTNFSADPLFVSTTPGAVDLRLKPGSPCIDRAPVNASIPVKDFLGNDRYEAPTIANVNGSTTDLGAYEYRP